jgi:hypothetical protein
MLKLSFKQNDNRIFRLYDRSDRENNNWISIYKGWGFQFIVGLGSYFDNRLSIEICLIWGRIYLHLPIYTKYEQCDPPRYGFYWYKYGGRSGDAFVICNGQKTKHYHMPWSMDWVRTSYLLPDYYTWRHEIKGYRFESWKCLEDGQLWMEKHPYVYKLKNGEEQHVIATISVEEREWRPRWFKWTSLFARKRMTINIGFSGEVGERAGSWKGGTVGCSYELRPDEAPVDALRRMEKERKFT